MTDELRELDRQVAIIRDGLTRKEGVLKCTDVDDGRIPQDQLEQWVNRDGRVWICNGCETDSIPAYTDDAESLVLFKEMAKAGISPMLLAGRGKYFCRSMRLKTDWISYHTIGEAVCRAWLAWKEARHDITSEQIVEWRLHQRCEAPWPCQMAQILDAYEAMRERAEKAEADNAALVAALVREVRANGNLCGDGPYGPVCQRLTGERCAHCSAVACLAQPHPGAALLAELAELRGRPS